MMLFTHEYVNDHIIRIRDISYTAVYVVIGKKQTVLIDTGIGIGSLKDYIETELQLHIDFVILTHGHLDHASGAIEFKDVPMYLHPLDRDLMVKHTSDKQERLRYTLDGFNRMKMTPPPIEENEILDPLPVDGIKDLEDGMIFDIGDYHLKVIHTPGHTQGMCMILFVEDRIILFGDACGVGVLLIEDCCSSVESYLKTLQKVKAYECDYDHIIRNHGSCESPKELLDNVIEVCVDILADRDDKAPGYAPIKTNYKVYQAKAVDPLTHKRLDGKEGNIIYAVNKIHD